ncbi:hypothetical protein [Microbacterium sp. ZXX196]|uniref:hypothetical protein n=1 Tax=Microbacterium sp. ZXX196 TaxID=2609291 RepID=UPI0012B9482F|nr:hypothetical protein [Microbacterium sp. ZXX196]MTE24459.1 hypothetical protein [Microbacterium sp. ZXX196]
MQRHWQLEVEPYPKGWLFVPETHEDDVRRQWISEAAELVMDSWGPHIDPLVRGALERLLAEIAASEVPGRVREMVMWPEVSLWPIRLLFVVLPSSAENDWERHGFRATPYETSAVGPGTQYTRARADEPSGPTLEAIFEFDRGDVRMLAHVLPLAVETFVRFGDEIASTLSAVRLVDGDGRVFESRRMGAGTTVVQSDEWPGEVLEEGASNG